VAAKAIGGSGVLPNLPGFETGSVRGGQLKNEKTKVKEKPKKRRCKNSEEGIGKTNYGKKGDQLKWRASQGLRRGRGGEMKKILREELGAGVNSILDLRLQELSIRRKVSVLENEPLVSIPKHTTSRKKKKKPRKKGRRSAYSAQR